MVRAYRRSVVESIIERRLMEEEARKAEMSRPVRFSRIRIRDGLVKEGDRVELDGDIYEVGQIDSEAGYVTLYDLETDVPVMTSFDKVAMARKVE